MSAEKKECGDVWMPREPKVADIVCQRQLNANGKHTGKHTFYRDGKPSVMWWGGRPA